MKEGVVERQHGLDVVVVVLVDSAAADRPRDGRLHVNSILDIGLVQPQFSLASVDARYFHRGREQLRRILARHPLGQGALIYMMKGIHRSQLSSPKTCLQTKKNNNLEMCD